MSVVAAGWQVERSAPRQGQKCADPQPGEISPPEPTVFLPGQKQDSLLETSERFRDGSDNRCFVTAFGHVRQFLAQE